MLNQRRLTAMVDVLLTHSYFLRFDAKEYRAMMPYPPLGTLYAASYLRQNGYSVALFDSMLAESESQIQEAIDTHRPRVVVIYDDDFNYLTKMCLKRMREAAFAMTGTAKRAHLPVIVHGSDPVDHLEEYFSHDADFVVCGEGEQTLKETLDHVLKGSRDPASIRGLAFIKDGVEHRTPPRGVLRDLDALPFPAWDLVDVERYRTLWRRRHGYFSVNMVTTRGCPFHCNWCAKPVYGQVYHSRSPENVVQEMKLMQATFRPDHIWFCDDIFGLKPGWVAQFSREVTRQNVVIPFKCLARVDLLLKENTIKDVAEAGCRTVWVGAESGSQKILDAMEKGTTVGQIYEATRKLKAAGIRVGFFLQYGYPGELEDDISRTLQMVRDCRPEEIGISVSYPLPGTKFYERVKQQLREKHNWYESKDLDVMFHGTYVPDYYRALHTVTHKKLRVWQGMEMLKQVASHPLRIDRRGTRRIAATAFHFFTLPWFQIRLHLLAQKSNGRPVTPSTAYPDGRAVVPPEY
jgi:radical SAM superfamily enzyme YgiQ (UPF0313 family)